MDSNPALEELLEHTLVPFVRQSMRTKNVFLMKEKINLKYPGQAAYGAHQVRVCVCVWYFSSFVQISA